MNINLFLIILLLALVAGFILGKWARELDPVMKVEVNDRKEDGCYLDMDKHPVWGIVEYRNGQFDCIWSDGYTKRGADKLCKKLNSDLPKNYGEYRVENMLYNKH